MVADVEVGGGGGRRRGGVGKMDRARASVSVLVCVRAMCVRMVDDDVGGSSDGGERRKERRERKQEEGKPERIDIG